MIINNNTTITDATGRTFKGCEGVQRAASLASNAQGRINPLPAHRAAFVLMFDSARPDFRKGRK